jgi:hypothetical protein
LKNIEVHNLFTLVDFRLPKLPFKSLFVSLNLNTLAQRYTLFMKQALVVIIRIVPDTH